MAHYALLDSDNIVTQVITGGDENENIDYERLYSNFHNQTCKRTSYNTYRGKHYTNTKTSVYGVFNRVESTDQSKAFRKNYAGIGFKYDSTRDAFIPPKPYNSWILNEKTCDWESPVEYPDDGNIYLWNEETQSWEQTT